MQSDQYVYMLDDIQAAPELHSGLRNIFIYAVLLLSLFTSQRALAALSLQQVEEIALQADPAVLMRKSRADAMQEKAIADGQLPDPKLGLSVVNLPLDSFDLKQEPMSQVVTRIQQSFPPGDSLHYQQLSTEWLGKAERANMLLAKQQIRRDVRQAFLELYYQDQSRKIIAQTRELFVQLVDITRVMFASGRVSQEDVLQAQLELSRLDERAIRIEEQRDIQRANLSRWIGDDSLQEIEQVFPTLPAIPAKNRLESELLLHPAIQNSAAKVKANEQLVKKAREFYKPGWNIGLDYRKRFGNNPNGTERTDMMAASISFNLPIFTDKRQDRRLAASQQNTASARQQKEERLRELRRMLRADYSRWLRLGEQELLYKNKLLKEAIANTKASMHSYQSGTSEFITLMRASITELDVRLKDLRIRVDRAKAQARLLYMMPGESSDPALNEGVFQ